MAARSHRNPGAVHSDHRVTVWQCVVRDTPYVNFESLPSPGRMGRALPKAPQIRSYMTNKRKAPRPLAMPTFGIPAGGRQCVKCKRWFHRSHFWRSNRRAYVNICADCLRPRATRPDVRRVNIRQDHNDHRDVKPSASNPKRGEPSADPNNGGPTRF